MLSSNWPPRPTKASPRRSSSAPGASPTKSQEPLGLPAPKTACWRVSPNEQVRQLCTMICKSRQSLALICCSLCGSADSAGVGRSDNDAAASGSTRIFGCGSGATGCATPATLGGALRRIPAAARKVLIPSGASREFAMDSGIFALAAACAGAETAWFFKGGRTGLSPGTAKPRSFRNCRCSM
jgi:hypothetical protein